MHSAKTLIDGATKVCQSRYALAKRLGVDEGNLGKMYRGSIPMPPALAARIAAIAGEDPAQTALEAIAAKEKDPAAREELARLFRLAPRAVQAIAAIAVVGTLGAITPSDAAAAIAGQSGAPDRLCIMSTNLRAWLRRLLGGKRHPIVLQLA